MRTSRLILSALALALIAACGDTSASSSRAQTPRELLQTEMSRSVMVSL